MGWGEHALDGVTKAKIASLTFTARRLARSEIEDLEGLARQFRLDPLIVRRVLENEGLLEKQGAAASSPKATTVELRAIK